MLQSLNCPSKIIPSNLKLVIPAKAGIHLSCRMKFYYVYILASKRNGTLYVGVTNDLLRRVFEHKRKMVKGFTSKYSVDKLVYYEQSNDVRIAIQREKQIKWWKRNWKIKLIEDFNPDWNDLYYELGGTDDLLDNYSYAE
jgi:putative endonuclease